MKKTIALLFLACALACPGQDVRPVRDDIGFCWRLPQMKLLMEHLAARERPDAPVGDLVAGISPHDDYLYAGPVYYPLFHDLRTKEAVIFGVTHGTVRKEIGDPKGVLILEAYASWTGLNGTVAISPLRERIQRELGKDDFIISTKAHSLEHSIEALVPFLHYNNPEIRITPIMVTAMPWERMQELSERLAEALAAYIREKGLRLGRDIFFLISADANHYGRDFANIPYGENEQAHEMAAGRDRAMAGALVDGRLDDAKVMDLTRKLWGATYLDYRDSYWCGKYDIPFGLLTIAKAVKKATGRSLHGRLLAYSDTYSSGVLPLKKAGFGITAPFSLKHWVGFFSAGFTLGREQEK